MEKSKLLGLAASRTLREDFRWASGYEDHSVMALRHSLALQENLRKLKVGGSLKEQWTAPLGLAPAPAARLRNYIIVAGEVRGAAGDTVTVPYVKDFQLDILETPGGELTPKTGLLGTVTTTLKEAAATTDISYADLEKMSPEIVTVLEERFAQASYRAEDKDLLNLLYAESGVPEVNHSGDDPADFKASYIAEALGKMMSVGKDVEFGDCTLVINGVMYDKMLEDIAGTQSLAWAEADAIRTGFIGQLFGVRILVAAYLPSGGSPAKYSAYLIHRNAVVLAPKRELLVEAEKKPRDREMQITGSHTFGDEIVDAEAAVEIKTAFTA